MHTLASTIVDTNVCNCKCQPSQGYGTPMEWSTIHILRVHRNGAIRWIHRSDIRSAEIQLRGSLGLLRAASRDHPPLWGRSM
eukprot:gene16278-biopygen18776